jgi:hypothetical protein
MYLYLIGTVRKRPPTTINLELGKGECKPVLQHLASGRVDAHAHTQSHTHAQTFSHNVSRLTLHN